MLHIKVPWAPDWNDTSPVSKMISLRHLQNPKYAPKNQSTLHLSSRERIIVYGQISSCPMSIFIRSQLLNQKFPIRLSITVPAKWSGRSLPVCRGNRKQRSEIPRKSTCAPISPTSFSRFSGRSCSSSRGADHDCCFPSFFRPEK